MTKVPFVVVEILSIEAAREPCFALTFLLPMSLNALIVVEPLTQVQCRVRLIEFVIEFVIECGVVVVVGIIPVISEGRRGRSSGATVLECPVKSVSCDRYAML